MRAGAPGIVAAATSDGLLDRAFAEHLAAAAAVRAGDPGFLPRSAGELADEARLAELAVTIAVARHSGHEHVTMTRLGADILRRGRDLRQVRKLLATGGVFSRGTKHPWSFGHGTFDNYARYRRMVPRSLTVAVDAHYLLAAAGLLSGKAPAAARALITRELPAWWRQEDTDE